MLISHDILASRLSFRSGHSAGSNSKQLRVRRRVRQAIWQGLPVSTINRGRML